MSHHKRHKPAEGAAGPSARSGAPRKPRRWPVWLAVLAAVSVAAYVAGAPGLFGTGLLGVGARHGRSFHHMGGERRPVMDPLLFTEASARHAYLAAQQNPEVLDQVWCYCGCDGPTLYHRSLLSCFSDYHGAGCSICQEEARTAARLKAAGATMEQIQDAIDRRFG